MDASDPLRTCSPVRSPRKAWARKAWARAGVALAVAMLVLLGGGSMAVAAPVAGPEPVGSVTASVPPVSTLDLRGCKGEARDPHYSNGARGIIIKMHLECRTSRTVDMLQGRLYKCPRVPTGSHTGWPRQGCVTPGNEILYNQFVSGGTTGRIWYVPGLGKPGLHGSGYWVGVAFWRDQGWTITRYSHVVYLNR